MTSNVRQPLRLRDDVVTDGGKVGRGAVQRAQVRRRLLRRAEGGRISHDRPDQTDPQGRRSTASRPSDFSSEEITGAFLKTIEAANPP